MKPVWTLHMCHENLRVPETSTWRTAGIVAALSCCGVAWGWVLYHLYLWVMR